MKFIQVVICVLLLSLSGCTSAEQSKEIKEAVEAGEKLAVAVETGKVNERDFGQLFNELKHQTNQVPAGPVKDNLTKSLDVYDDLQKVWRVMLEAVAKKDPYYTDSELEKQLVQKYPHLFPDPSVDLIKAQKALGTEANSYVEKAAAAAR